MNIKISKESLDEKKKMRITSCSTSKNYNALEGSLSAFSCKSALQQQSWRKFIHVFQTTTNDFVESGVKIYNACPENLYFQLEISCHRSR